MSRWRFGRDAWVCCQCSQTNLVLHAPERCPGDGHWKCYNCYGYGGGGRGYRSPPVSHHTSPAATPSFPPDSRATRKSRGEYAGKKRGSEADRDVYTDSGYQSRPKHESQRQGTVEPDGNESICTDGRNVDLPNSIKVSFVTLFAEQLVDHIGATHLNHRSNVVREVLPSLLRDFSVLLRIRAKSEVHEEAITFVRHQRIQIANETNVIAQSRPDPVDVPHWREKVELWDGIQESAGPNPTENLFLQGEEDDEESHPEDIPLPKDAKQAQSFLTEGHEFQWLMDQIRVSLPLSHCAPATDGKVRSQLLDCFASEPELHETPRRAVFVAQWDPCRFMEEQYQQRTSLETVVVLVGHIPQVEVTTCGVYVKRRWPDLGARFVSCLDKALAQSAQTAWIPSAHHPDVMVTVDSTGGITRVTCTGCVETIVEIGEILAWVGAACRAPPSLTEITYCKPLISTLESSDGTELQISYNSDCAPGSDTSTEHDCWRRMFANPTIAGGYPITSRTAELPDGLEMPFDLMFTLAEATRLLDYGGGLVMKGAISLLVPTLYTARTLVWHFLVNKDKSRMKLGCADDLLKTDLQLKPAEMSAFRHIVGWTRRAHVLAGSDRISYDIRHSGSELARPAPCAMSAATFSVGKIATAGATFTRGKKETPDYFSGSPYELQIEHAVDLSIVMHDSKSNIAWLLDGASVLLHLCRTWMLSNVAKNAKANTLQHLEHTSDLNGSASARQALLSKNNRSIRLFAKEIEEQVRESDAVSQSTESTIKTTWWRFEDLVSEKWSLLEQIDANITKLRNEPPPPSIGMPHSRRLEGFEFVELLLGRSIQRRFVDLAGNEWLPMVKDIGALPILAADLGDLIIPANAGLGSVAVNACSRNTVVPRGHDLLAVHNTVLERLSYDNFDKGTFRIGDSKSWIQLSCTGACPCASNARKGCGGLITQLLEKKEAEKAKRVGPVKPTEVELGASVFGKISRSLVKKDGKRSHDECPATDQPTRKLRRKVSDSGIDVASSSNSSGPTSTSSSNLPFRSPTAISSSTRSQRRRA